MMQFLIAMRRETGICTWADFFFLAFQTASEIQKKVDEIVQGPTVPTGPKAG